MDEAAPSSFPRSDAAPVRRHLAAIADGPQRRPIVVVLGMHRSGTSLCSHILSLLGVDMADDVGIGIGNDRGHWERWEIVGFHDRILEVLNRGFYSPFHDFPLPPGWWADPQIGQIRRELAGFLRERMADGLFGFKDPRTLRLLPLWRQVFGDLKLAPKLVLCLRNPAEVARSLHARDGLDPVNGEYRWLVYMSDFFRYVGDTEFCTVAYESWFAAPDDNLHRLREFLGLDGLGAGGDLAAALAEVIDPGLRHDAGGREAADPLVRDVYRLALAAGHDGAARRRLQQLVSQFAGLERLRQPLHRAHEAAAAAAGRVPGLEAELAASRDAAAAAQAARDEAAARAETAEAALRETEARAARLGEIEARLAEREAELASAREAVAGLRDDAAAAQAARDEAAARAETAEAALREAEARAARLGEIEARLAERETELAGLRDAAAAAQAARDEAAARAETAAAALREAEARAARLGEIEARLAEREAELASAREAVAAAEAQAAAERRQAAAAAAEAQSALAALCARAETAEAALHRALAEAAARLGEVEARLVERETALAEARHALAGLSAALETAELRLADEAAAAQAALREQAEAELAVAAERAERGAALARAEAEAAGLRAALAEATGSLDATAQRLRTAEQEAAAARAERDAARAETAALRTELGGLRDALGRAEGQAKAREAQAAAALATADAAEAEAAAAREVGARLAAAFRDEPVPGPAAAAVPGAWWRRRPLALRGWRAPDKAVSLQTQGAE